MTLVNCQILGPCYSPANKPRGMDHGWGFDPFFIVDFFSLFFFFLAAMEPLEHATATVLCT